jgi:hypothetical protein
MVADGSLEPVKEKKLKIAGQEGVKLRSEWEETHLRTFCVEEKRARFAPEGRQRGDELFDVCWCYVVA